MRKMAVAAAALVFAAGAIFSAPQAEARRGWGGVGAGIVAAAVVGGIIAANSGYRYRTPYYGYGYGSGYGYGYPSYYGPSYYSYGAPYYGYSRSYYRPVYAYRPIRVYRSGFVGHRSHFRGGHHRRR